ncbi:MAG: sulfur oxidation c-type cytochrome SoxX [Henriciella sp.]|jgi:sulfur-oxidizing protein SoxX
MNWAILAIALVTLCLPACNRSDVQLVANDQIVGDTIPQPLTTLLGRPEIGQTLFNAREAGHCVLCHQVADSDRPFQGNLGPDLTLVGDRLSAGQLRLRIADYDQFKPGTVMPSYYRTHDLYQVGEAFQNAPILTAQEVEDLVAYLAGLKE